jgi:iron complex outermembrane receptor protein
MADYGLLADATRDGALLAGHLGRRGTGSGPGGYGDARPGSAWHGARTPASYPGTSDVATRAATGPTVWLGTAGLVAQATLAVDDAWFVTAGLRGERNDGFSAASRFAALPTLGVAAVRPLGGGAGAGGATVKLRAAYGAGHRPARTPTRSVSWRGAGRTAASFGPETQRGVEAGVDLLAGGRPGTPTVTASVTRFDQRASGLLQQVVGPPPGGWTSPRPTASPTPGPHRFGYQIENVGEIDNRGWEFESALQAGPLALGATASFVDSRVRRTVRSYNGDLRAGDRMLQVPRRTLGAHATWQGGRWSAAAQVARASDWINYDRLALTAASARPPWQLVGDSLRTFWRRYPGVTHFGASVTRDVTRGLSVVLTGSNLLGRQQGEPDNATVLPGRTITAGVRATF